LSGISKKHVAKHKETTIAFPDLMRYLSSRYHSADEYPQRGFPWGGSEKIQKIPSPEKYPKMTLRQISRREPGGFF
jgi:hypothetical protein